MRAGELQHSRLEIVCRLGRAAEYRDNETGLHVIRMSHCAEIIGRHDSPLLHLARDIAFSHRERWSEPVADPGRENADG